MKALLMTILSLATAMPTSGIAQDSVRQQPTQRDSGLRVVRLEGTRTDVYLPAVRDSARRSTFAVSGRPAPSVGVEVGQDVAAFAEHLFPPELIMQNQSRLKLTEPQRNAILQEIYKLQATATQVQWRVADEAGKLNELLARETVTEADVLSQAERMMGYEVAVKRAQLAMLVRIRNLLTPEQKAMLKELRRKE